MFIKFFKYSEINGVIYHHFRVEWSGPLAFEFELMDRYSHMRKFKRRLENSLSSNYKLPSFPSRCFLSVMAGFTIRSR
jgi:hypothetical protein